MDDAFPGEEHLKPGLPKMAWTEVIVLLGLGKFWNPFTLARGMYHRLGQAMRVNIFGSFTQDSHEVTRNLQLEVLQFRSTASP